jgi:glyoxylase-like metal-dependent hydrolase (beta-lactamase superfamily II)
MMPLAQVKLECLPVGEMGVNCYILENPETRQCLVVDPGDEAGRILAQVGDRKVEAVLLTHGHFDHMGAVDAVCAATGAPLYIHSGDMNKLTDPNANVSGIFGGNVTVQTPAIPLEDGDVVEAAGFPLRVMNTPGHTNGCVCYLLPEDGGVLTGDTVFAHGYGRTDFPDGDFHKLVDSFRRIMRITPRQTAWPGHEGPGLVGRDKPEDA